MKKILLLAILLLPLASFAQGTDNPAENALRSSGFVRVGDWSSTARNNVGASSFIFPSGHKLVTGLHSSVSQEDFLGSLKAVNSLYSAIDYNLFAYGWEGRSRGFHTVEFGIRADYGLSVPKEIFTILKTGTAQSPYDLSSFRAFGNLYGELSYGYALTLGEGLSLGGRVKLLAGLNSVDLLLRDFSLTTTEDEYVLAMDADIDLTNRNKKAGEDADGYLDYTSFSGKGKLGVPTGAGLALDLGVVWEPLRGFRVSASVLDLGAILWYYGNAGTSSGSFTFEGLKNLSMDQMDQETMNSKLRAAGEELLGVVRPKAVEGRVKVKAVPLTAKLDAIYAMPFYERLSAQVSGLYSGHSFCAPYWEARGGLALDYPGTAHLQLSAGSGAYGFVYGIGGSVDFVSFTLHAAYENGVGGVIPYEGTPLKANNKVLTVGLTYNIPSPK